MIRCCRMTCSIVICSFYTSKCLCIIQRKSIIIVIIGRDVQGADFIVVTIFLNTITIIKSSVIKVATNHSETQSGTFVSWNSCQHSRSII